MPTKQENIAAADAVAVAVAVCVAIAAFAVVAVTAVVLVDVAVAAVAVAVAVELAAVEIAAVAPTAAVLGIVVPRWQAHPRWRNLHPSSGAVHTSQFARESSGCPDMAPTLRRQRGCSAEVAGQ